MIETSPINVLIVDDEKSARENIIALLHKYPFVVEVFEASNANEGLQLIRKNNPDIVFLDIDMPGKNGIELLKEIRQAGIDVHVVFVTAFNQFAIDAIKCAAFDYILKPIDEAEFDATIKRLQTGLAQNQSIGSQIDTLIEYLTPAQLKINTKRGLQLLSIDKIAYALAQSNYTEIIMCDESKHLVSITLARIEQMLPACNFIRAGRSLVINKNLLVSTDRIKKQIALLAGDKLITLALPLKNIRELEKLV